MTDDIEGEVTHERKAKRMPPEIAAAVAEVLGAEVLAGKDSRNKHQGYDYASIDVFFGLLRGEMAKAGLWVSLEELAVTYKASDGKTGEKGAMWAFATYGVSLVHRTGVMFDAGERRVAMPMTGPQTFGSMESYCRKAYMRGLFMIPTGDSDGDDVAPSEPPSPRRPAVAYHAIPHETPADATPSPVVPGTPVATRAKPALANPSPDQIEASKISARLRAEIATAKTLFDLNELGIFGKTREQDMQAILKVPGGDKVWQDLINRDADRRLQVP